MKVDVEQLSPVERKLSVEVPWEAVKQELDQAYRDLSKKARLKGFRAGKVPRKVLEQYFRTSVENQVVNQIVDDSFKKVVEQESLHPIDNPVMETLPTVTKDHPLTFSATVQVRPEVEVQSYKGLSVVKKIRKVEDSEVDAELNTLREKSVVIEQITDRNVCEKGDLAVIDFFGSIDGEDFKGGKGINYTIEVGSGQMIPGFEDQLEGMTIGDEKNFELTFPDNYGGEDLQGKTAAWKVDLKELKKKILPDLDDEFAKDLGEYDTLDELKEGLRANIATREDARTKRMLRSEVLEKLVDENPVDVPSVMTDRQLNFMLRDASQMAGQGGDEMIEVLSKLREDFRPQAERQVAGNLLLEAIARKESLDVEDGELEAKIQDLAREHRMNPRDVKIQLKQNDQIDALKESIRTDKAVDFLMEHAEVTEQTVTTEELEAEQREKTEALAASGDEQDD